tara:strand:+ start:152 stop:583 length:432 start_codon:yes stop_codon:yes gene_type:complete
MTARHKGCAILKAAQIKHIFFADGFLSSVWLIICSLLTRHLHLHISYCILTAEQSKIMQPDTTQQMRVSAMNMNEAIEAIYTSLENDNEDIDFHIANLKAAMKEEDAKEAVFQTERLAQNNRQGRKVMQAYFKKRGIKVVFNT